MNEYVKVISHKQPIDLLNSTLNIYLKGGLEPMWFKVLSSGKDSDGKLFIGGVDIEMMNRFIYTDEIDNVVVVR